MSYTFVEAPTINSDASLETYQPPLLANQLPGARLAPAASSLSMSRATSSQTPFVAPHLARVRGDPRVGLSKTGHEPLERVEHCEPRDTW